MDQINNTNYHEDAEEEEFEETLSLCDLSLEDYQDQDKVNSPLPNSPTYNPDLFEFPNFMNSAQNDVVFCGKLIKEQDFDDDGDDHGQSSRYPFPVSSFRLFSNNKRDLGSLQKPSRSSGSKSPGFGSSSPSRKQCRVFIGLAKLPSTMELSDIKKRQSRRRVSSSPMLPPKASKDLEMMAAAEGCGAGGGHHGHWGMLKPLRSRGHLVNALLKVGFRCISHV